MALADVRPDAVDLLIRAGTTITVVLEWPTGALAGRSFTSRLDGAPLALSVVDDTITVVADDVITGALTTPVDWLLLEDIDGTDEPALIGLWTPSDSPRAVDGATVKVTEGAATVTVNPASAQASVVALDEQLNAHEALNIGDVHGVVEHNWGRHTWADFQVIVRTPDPDADWERTVEDGKGVVTAVQPSGGDGLRTVAARSGTSWVDAEIRSLILPPSKWTGANTQMGHSHRLREISPGVHEAINIWTSIVFGGDYGTLHIAAVRNDGINPTLQSDTANDTGSEAASIDRRSAVRAHTRFSFGSDFNVYRITPNRGLLDTLAAGDVVTIADLDDSTFNETDIALDSTPDRLAEQVRVIDPSESTPVDWTDDFGGHITPSGTSAQKRWAPFYMATRVVGGSSSSVPVEIKRWRKGEPEPGWDDARVRRVDVVPNANVPAMPLGPGLHGVLDAHLHDDTSQYWGDLHFRRL